MATQQTTQQQKQQPTLTDPQAQQNATSSTQPPQPFTPKGTGQKGTGANSDLTHHCLGLRHNQN
ncbi:hypothetical protein PN462_10930 [Spirulina sp. CS-785/01]|uniref:hypothetical protein n=1 Tax=Spirulina sp. CS-785/01 TaxID=3021716 RepID=UPI00232BDF6D|nr:hypothetical protein [Spirulina sp. CS-785/01]MDB9313614.1 hypothetical protein [Spirulina sp. CS-785/01]